MDTRIFKGLAMAALAITIMAIPQVRATTLSITDDNEYFIVDPEDGIQADTLFLYGVSYYGALADAPGGMTFAQRLVEDLNYFQANGFNWVRVWTHWGGYWDEGHYGDDLERAKRAAADTVSDLLSQGLRGLRGLR